MHSGQQPHYQVVEGHYQSPEGESYIGYGIRGEWRGETVTLVDLSRRRIPVERLAHCLEEREVSLLHLRELVEDWLDQPASREEA